MPRPFFVVMGILIVFWAVVAVVAATTFALATRPGEQAAATATLPPDPTPTEAPDPVRPAAVPETALLVRTEFASGDARPLPATPFAERDIFYALRCDDGLLIIATTDETVYATLDCGRYWLPDEVVRAYLAMSVRVRVVPGHPARLSFESENGDVARFLADAVWVEVR